MLDRKLDFDAGLVDGKVFVCEVPPSKKIVPLKPVFFDIAYNYLSWPDFSKAGVAGAESEDDDEFFDDVGEFDEDGGSEDEDDDEFEDAEQEGGILESVTKGALGWFGLGGK